MKSNGDQFRIKTNYRRAKVLIIEDNNDQYLLIQKAMQEVLPEITLVRVAIPEQAIALLDEWRHQEWEIPKLILMDLYLPDSQDGWTLLKQIKGLGAPFKQIPVVMLSASADSTDIAEAYQLGVSSYLVKPTDYLDWLAYFTEVRTYWWETVTLPPIQFSI